MNPQIQVPRSNQPLGWGPNSSATAAARGVETVKLRMPRFFRRLFKFPQMDFEMAIWEMTSLLFAPKKVFRSMYYHKQTKNTWHRPDPSFTYLMSFFMLLTGLAWGVAIAPNWTGTLRLTIVYVVVHFLLGSLVIATFAYFFVGRFLGAGIQGLPGRRRQQGLFTSPSERDSLEFGYCFDVSIRAFFPVWVLLYVLQFVLMPVITKDYWLSLLLGNTIYLVAAGYYFVVSFLGYNALPFLHHTEFLLTPCVLAGILWFISLFGFNIPKHLVVIFVLGSGSSSDGQPAPAA